MLAAYLLILVHNVSTYYRRHGDFVFGPAADTDGLHGLSGLFASASLIEEMLLWLAVAVTVQSTSNLLGRSDVSL